LAAGLIDIPRVNALRVYFGNGPGNRVLMNPLGKLGSPLGSSFLESSSPTMRRLGFRITAAATTGPNSAPRPLRPDPQYESIQAAAPLARNGKSRVAP